MITAYCNNDNFVKQIRMLVPVDSGFGLSDPELRPSEVSFQGRRNHRPDRPDRPRAPNPSPYPLSYPQENSFKWTIWTIWTIPMESLIQGERNMSETESLPVAVESCSCHLQRPWRPNAHIAAKNFLLKVSTLPSFLYGIFFLVGKDNGYAGITCPTCLKTICHQDSREKILQVKAILTESIR